MKMRAGCVVLAAMMTVMILSGCQSSVVKTEKSEVAAAEAKTEKKAASKPAPPKHEYNVTWQQDCTVQQAYSAGQRVIQELGFQSRAQSTRTIRTRDPRTGRTVTKQVPVSSSGAGKISGRSDGLSGFLSIDTVGGIKFEVSILMLSPESCRISISAVSSKQGKDILQKQSIFLKDQMSQAIKQDLAEPETVDVVDKGLESFVLDCTMGQAYDLIDQWGKKWGFDHKDSGGDRYSYKYMSYETGSDIRFNFKFRMLDSQKTKLELQVNNADGKDEYAVIRQSLDDAIQGGLSVTTASYTDTKLLQKSVGDVTRALMDWAKGNGLKWDDDRRDVFYSRGNCYTSSGIRFSFTMRLVEADQARLIITADNFEGKDEFNVIVKSLEAALAALEKPAEAAETATETATSS